MTVPADAAPEDTAAIEAAAEARHAFARDLAAFRIHSGEPSYQQISRAATRYRVTPSGITDMLSGKRLPPNDFLIEFVRAVEQVRTGRTDSPESKALVKYWHGRWVSARSLEREAQAPRKRVIDALLQQARNEAAEMLTAARREVEAAFASAGNHHVRHTRAKQLQQEELRQAQEAAEELLSKAQQTAHTLLYEAQHHEDKAARMARSLEQRATCLSDEAQHLETEAARLARVEEENRAESARLEKAKKENQAKEEWLQTESERVDQARTELLQAESEHRESQLTQEQLSGQLQRLFQVLVGTLQTVPKEEAVSQYAKIILIVTELLGAEARETLTLRADYAVALEESNWISDAKDLLERLYPVVKTTLGPHDSLTQRVREHQKKINPPLW